MGIARFARRPRADFCSEARGMTRRRTDPSAGTSSEHGETVAAERLVGLGFRYWLTGFRTGDISCWERAWCVYSEVLGAQAAKGVVTDLAGWVRSINRHARRDLKTAAVDCERFCRDECIAIEMISACQHEACPAMRACAFALLGCSMIDEVVNGAESFAATMRGADLVLPQCYSHASSLRAMQPASALAQ
jgi:hypothetical protein